MSDSGSPSDDSKSVHIHPSSQEATGVTRRIKDSTPQDDDSDQSKFESKSKHSHQESFPSGLLKDQIRLKAQILKAKYAEQLEQFEELSTLFDEFLAQINDNSRGQQIQSSYPEKPITKDGNLLKKRFHAQPSLLTLSTVINDLMYHGTIGFDFQLFRYTFGKFTYVLKIWLIMQILTLVGVYWALSSWEKARQFTLNKNVVNIAFSAAYVVYQLAFVAVPAFVMAHLQLPPASAAIVVSEQIRFLMKSHAFVREKVPAILAHSDKSVYILDFSKYLYFQFVPTLIYRDSYPRTKRIRWNLVLTYFANVLGAILYAYYIFLRFCIPVFQNFNHVHVNLPTIINSMFSCILPGSLLFVIVFFALLHCWMNAFAEMLQFADRLFYKDWWNSTNFSNYYRTWNIVVHDWLYTYIYRDMYIWLGAKYRNASMMATFLISALFHEYVFCCMFRFFYPVLFCLFAGVGVLLMFATQRKSSPPWNILLWTFLLMGLGVLMSLYTMEYYARFNCPASTENKILDYIIPRSWTCYVVVNEEITAPLSSVS